MDWLGFTQGPPLWLHPGQLNSPTSMSSSVAVRNMVCSIFHHSSLNRRTGPTGVPCPSPIIPIWTRFMPAFFMACRSFTTPSSDIFPAIQYQYTAIGWSCGVSRNFCSIVFRLSAKTCVGQPPSVARAANPVRIFFMFFRFLLF